MSYPHLALNSILMVLVSSKLYAVFGRCIRNRNLPLSFFSSLLFSLLPFFFSPRRLGARYTPKIRHNGTSGKRSRSNWSIFIESHYRTTERHIIVFSLTEISSPSQNSFQTGIHVSMKVCEEEQQIFVKPSEQHSRPSLNDFLVLLTQILAIALTHPPTMQKGNQPMGSKEQYPRK